MGDERHLPGTEDAANTPRQDAPGDTGGTPGGAGGRRLVRIATESRREAAAVRLAAGDSQAEAARSVGVGKNTIGRWAKEASFLARVEELRASLTEATVQARVDHTLTTLRALEELQAQAVRTLGELLQATVAVPDKEEGRATVPAHVRAACAVAVLKQAQALRSEAVLAERVAQLEQTLGLRPPAPATEREEEEPT